LSLPDANIKPVLSIINMKGVQDIASVLGFKGLFEMAFGIILFIWVFYQVSSLMYSSCWQEVNRPFKSFTDALAPGSSIEVSMNPSCLDRLVITRSPERCRMACSTSSDCSSNCFGSGKTFFIAVKKQDDSGSLTKTVSWVTQTATMVKRTFFERSESYSALCNLDVEAIECAPQEESRYVKIYLDGAFRGDCRIRANVGSPVLPPLCRVVR